MMPPCTHSNRSRRSRGFTLIELAVVIGVITILLGAVIAPLASQNTARLLRNEHNAQREIRDALMGYAIVNRRLPCPDNDRDGLEDQLSVGPIVCNPGLGFLPWNDLGVRGTDTWGRLYGYRVDADFVMASVPGTPAPNATGLDLQDTSTITISDYNDSKATFTLVNGVAAVVLSVGANGYGGFDIDGNAMASVPAANLNEASNVDGNTAFVYRTHSPEQGTCNDAAASAGLLCEFDDVLTWVPPNLLFLRMVEGGALP